MTELVAANPRLEAVRHLWGSIARDLVLMTLPQPNTGTAVSLPGLLKHYELSGEDLKVLMAREDFRETLANEKKAAAALGRQAAHAIRTGEMAADLAEEIYRRAKNNQAVPLAELTKAYVALARSAGFEEIHRPKEGGGTTVNVGVGMNFTLPKLENTKLRHLET